MTKKKWYGFYSEKAARQFGTVVWKTPDGRDVHCTLVDDDPSGARYGFDDAVCIGEVTEFIKSFQISSAGAKIVHLTRNVWKETKSG